MAVHVHVLETWLDKITYNMIFDEVFNLIESYASPQPDKKNYKLNYYYSDVFGRLLYNHRKSCYIIIGKEFKNEPFDTTLFIGL